MSDSEGYGMMHWMTVEIHRVFGEPLGIAFDMPAMVVRHVSSDSAAGKWNKANPEMSIREGDKLVEANGYRSVEGIARECQGSAVLRLAIARDSEDFLARRFVQDVMADAGAYSSCGSESSDCLAWEVQAPSEMDNSEDGSPNHSIAKRSRSPLGSMDNIPAHFFSSPYAAVVAPEGKPRRGKNKRKQRPGPGFRACCMRPPDHQEVLLPSLPHQFSPPPPSVLPTFHQPYSPGKIIVPPMPMPEWMVREMSKATEGPMPLPPPGCAYSGGSRPQGHLNMYSRPPWEQVPRPAFRTGAAHSEDARRQVEEDQYRTWRENMVNRAISLARTSDIPRGLLPSMGARGSNSL